jgi:hypothetical protein
MTPDEQQTTLAVAIGRIEEMVKSMNEKLARIDETTERQWERIGQLETDIAILKSKQGPKVPWVTYAAGIAALAALILGVLDRIFVNQ